MAWYGRAFLEASIGNALRRICAEKVAIEVDPLRSGKGVKDVERNVELLIYWCHEFWKQIYSVRAECPKWVTFAMMPLKPQLIPVTAVRYDDCWNISANLSRNDIIQDRIRTGIYGGRAYLLSVSCGS